MSRLVWVVAPDAPDAQAIAGANAAGTGEISWGVPKRLEGVIPANKPYPFLYVEPDDPDKAPVAQAITILRNQLNRPAGTDRTTAQVNNALDVLSLWVLRRVLRDRD